MCSMNIFNKIHSISKDYTKIETLFSSKHENNPLSIHHIMQFQKAEIERTAIQNVLSLLDQGIQGRYEQLVSSL